MVQGQVFLKEGGWHFSYLMLSRFIIFTFRNLPFTKLCDAFTGYFDYFDYFIIVLSFFFFCHHNFMKEGNSKLSKNEPENLL